MACLGGDREVRERREQDKVRERIYFCGFLMSCGSKYAAGKLQCHALRTVLWALRADVLMHVHGVCFSYCRASEGMSHFSLRGLGLISPDVPQPTHHQALCTHLL